MKKEEDYEILSEDNNNFEITLSDTIGENYHIDTDSDKLLDIILSKLIPLYNVSVENKISFCGNSSSMKAFLTMIGNAFIKLNNNK